MRRRRGSAKKVPIPSQVESSGLEGRCSNPMVCSHSPAGVAPGEAAQSRGDGVGSGSSRRKPSRVIGNRAEGFPVRDAFCFW